MKWRILTPDKAALEPLTKELGIPPLVARLLINRQVVTPSSARPFLKPNLANLSDPYSLDGVKPAVELINETLRRKEKIAVYGDYDTDGVTGTALLLNMFRLIDTEADFYIPHRLEEGYGLNIKALERMSKNGVRLLITVDCGITDYKEVSYAVESGLSVIITDHHEPVCGEDGTPRLPQANVIINPKLSRLGGILPRRDEGVNDLSGVGVAFKLVWAFTQQFTQQRKRSPEFQQFLMEAMTLVVVGTVTDVVPLAGENRILTAYGLPLLRNLSLPWLDALIETSRIDRRYLNTRDIGFRIGPRLNAGGRLGESRIALELLLTRSRHRAKELAEQLEKANQNRQRLEKRILEDAREMIKNEININKDYIIVLADKNWHVGVIGIVASKLAEEFNRPTIIFSLQKDSAKGSGRSIEGFNLYEALRHCQDFVTEMGGHTYAVGVEMAPAKLDGFKKAISEYARTHLAPADLTPSLQIDTEASLDELSLATVRQIEQMAPFGEGNPEPVLLTKSVTRAGELRLCGAQEEHCAFVVRPPAGGTSFRVIAFHSADRYNELVQLGKKPFQIVYTPQIDQYNGGSSVVLNLKDFKTGS